MKEENLETEKMHKSALDLIKKELIKHNLGKLEFLAFVGTRPWGISRKNVDYDYRGIYSNKEEKTYQAFISQVYINNWAKDITLVSLERLIRDIFEGYIHSLIVINSPVIYESKDFFNFRRWANSHFSKKVYFNAQPRRAFQNRKDYLYDFFFMGNGISILEKKKVIANLPKLNKEILKIPFIDKLIEEERNEMPFEKKAEKECKKIIERLKKRLDLAYQKSNLPSELDKNKLKKLKIVKKINYEYWLQEGFSERYKKERENLGFLKRS